MAAVTSWSIDPAVPNADWRAPYAGDDPNSTAFGAWVKNGASRVTVSAPMTCLAQQYARFDAEHPEKIPGADVRAFIHTRCGAPFDTVEARRWSFEPDKFHTLDPKRPQPHVLALLEGASAPTIAGLGVWKGDKQVVVSVLVGEPRLELPLVALASSGGAALTSPASTTSQPSG